MAHKLVIIGSGPAGHTAAIYAARANLEPVMIEGFRLGGVPGGQLMITTVVENYPGFPERVTGPELMDRFKAQSEKFGTKIISEDVVRVDLSASPFKLWYGESDPQLVEADAVIVATGARAKWLGIPGEHELENRGVSACATCDGSLFRNQPVAVVGGGDTAMEEALYLANLCSKVTLIHRRDSFRASKIMAQRVLAHPKIEVVWSSVVQRVLEPKEERVTALVLENVVTHATSELAVEGLFVAIGHVPNTSLFRDWLDLDEAGYIQTVPGSTRTKIEGVFAAGDVQDHVFRQAVTAAGTGCMAAIEAERWLSAREAAGK
ncbi:MAG: thioredoxin-disulfide reductase [Deltaproteobacteria bacterium]|nr:thioredoxin-disulfide reductase [Deltaproteobacteria bacterium]